MGVVALLALRLARAGDHNRVRPNLAPRRFGTFSTAPPVARKATDSVHVRVGELSVAESESALARRKHDIVTD